MNNRVEAFSYKSNDQIGYDIRIVSENATVQDYLDALNNLIESDILSRTRREVVICKGCKACCNERIPLTIVDVRQLQQHFNYQHWPIGKVIAEFGYVTVEGPVVDIALAAGPKGNCIFLDDATGCCQKYASRSLVCQTFICCPSTKRAEDLRSTIVNLGMDALIRIWLDEVVQNQSELVVHEAYDPAINPADWNQNTFPEVESYSKVPLKAICSSNLWRELKK